MGAESVVPELLVRNLGLHLLVATSDLDVVAVCLHPLGIREADASHYLLERDGVPYAAPDSAVRLPETDVRSYRRLAYLRAKSEGLRSQAVIAERLGVCPRTLRNWLRKGWL